MTGWREDGWLSCPRGQQPQDGLETHRDRPADRRDAARSRDPCQLCDVLVRCGVPELPRPLQQGRFPICPNMSASMRNFTGLSKTKGASAFDVFPQPDHHHAGNCLWRCIRHLPQITDHLHRHQSKRRLHMPLGPDHFFARGKFCGECFGQNV